MADSRTSFRAQRTFWTFAILTWLLAMLCNLGVAIYERESAGAMAFTFTLLSVAIAFWLGSSAGISGLNLVEEYEHAFGEQRRCGGVVGGE